MKRLCFAIVCMFVVASALSCCNSAAAAKSSKPPQKLDQPTLLFVQGETAYKSGDYKTAVERWKQVLQLMPDSAHTKKMLKLAEDHLAAAPIAPGAPADTKVAQSAANDEEARKHYLIGEEAFRTGDIAYAIKEWSKTLELKPDSLQTQAMMRKAQRRLAIQQGGGESLSPFDEVTTVWVRVTPTKETACTISGDVSYLHVEKDGTREVRADDGTRVYVVPPGLGTSVNLTLQDADEDRILLQSSASSKAVPIIYAGTVNGTGGFAITDVAPDVYTLLFRSAHTGMVSHRPIRLDPGEDLKQDIHFGILE